MSSRDSAMSTYGIQQCCICSFDEPGFRIVVEKDQEVACTSDHQSQLPLHSDTNQETVTIVESTSGDYVSPPMTIVPGVLHQERRSTTTNIGGETLISVLDPGNFNDVLCFEWIKHFKWFTKTRQHGKWRLLLHSTVTAQRGSLISAMITIPFHLHTIHLLQPLDSVCFQSYKNFRAEAVDKATRTGCSDINELEFFAGLSTISEQTFKRMTIFFAFRQIG